LRVRVSLFAVGDRGEAHRRDERRIQITTTFQSGLARLFDYRDIVLGYDSENDAYVGLDARRLEYGGEHHNASSSVDAAALARARNDRIEALPRDSHLFGVEYQAVFRAGRLAEYIFNADRIHRGSYSGDGVLSGAVRLRPPVSVVHLRPGAARGDELVMGRSSERGRRIVLSEQSVLAYERGEMAGLRDISPMQLQAIQEKCREIGDRGEFLALRHEQQRLRAAGKPGLARRVDWVSRRAIGLGYDIASFEVSGAPRLIEVKSTSGRGMTFFMSANEWEVAVRERTAYHIYRYVEVDDAPRLARIVPDPVGVESEARLERFASGWRVVLI